jgi:hypothetical protein
MSPGDYTKNRTTAVKLPHCGPEFAQGGKRPSNVCLFESDLVHRLRGCRVHTCGQTNNGITSCKAMSGRRRHDDKCAFVSQF